MILRKPYAFLIKNFKKIHLILSIAMIYIVYKCSGLSAFFNDYINNGSYNQVVDLASSYINNYLYLAIIFVIIITTIVFILMKQKEKPTLLYLIIDAVYLAIIIYLFQAYNALDIIEIATLNPQTARIYRDASSLLVVAQYIIIIFILVRAVGFDIKRFNFGEDIEKLHIEASDNEEFELTVGVDTARIRRGFVHQLREIKYFIVENIFIVFIIIFIAVFVIGLGLYLNFEVYNKVYQEQIKIQSNIFTLEVNKSYYTSDNYKGESIASKDKVYVIADMAIYNKTTDDQTINLNSINLIINNTTYKAMSSNYSSFSDLGIGYKGQQIDVHEARNFIFVFEVKKDDINDNNIILRYTETLYNNSQKIKGKYKKIELNPISLDKKKVTEKIKLEDKVLLNKSLLKNSYIEINTFDFNNKYAYNTMLCTTESCSVAQKYITLKNYIHNNILMKLSISHEIDKSISYMNINNAGELIEKYGKILYKLNDKNYVSNLTNRTPDDYKENDVYFEIPMGVSIANSIELVLNIRNREYKYILKSS